MKRLSIISWTDLTSSLAGHDLAQIVFDINEDKQLTLKTDLCMTTADSVFTVWLQVYNYSLYKEIRSACL